MFWHIAQSPRTMVDAPCAHALRAAITTVVGVGARTARWPSKLMAKMASAAPPERSSGPVLSMRAGDGWLARALPPLVSCHQD
jgi:hypothetical protein